jgi:adenosine deaminase
MRVAFLVSINRGSPVEHSSEAVDLLIRLKENSVNASHLVGIELSGDPRKGSFADFKPEFDRARQHGFKVTLHCGETE